VLGCRGIRWVTVTISGKEAHTGSTPFESRSDALLCASKLIIASNEIAKKHEGLVTTGVISSSPQSTNTIPGQVTFSLDFRHFDDKKMAAMSDEIQDRLFQIAEKESEAGCKAEWKVDVNRPALLFDETAIDCVKRAAQSLVPQDKIKSFFSGIGHDSCCTASKVPTAMIFVPSKGGVSHTPIEYTSPEDCALGAQTLLRAVLNYDAIRS